VVSSESNRPARKQNHRVRQSTDIARAALIKKVPPTQDTEPSQAKRVPPAQAAGPSQEEKPWPAQDIEPSQGEISPFNSETNIHISHHPDMKYSPPSEVDRRRASICRGRILRATDSDESDVSVENALARGSRHRRTSTGSKTVEPQKKTPTEDPEGGAGAPATRGSVGPSEAFPACALAIGYRKPTRPFQSS
jgi:hypothetical protein